MLFVDPTVWERLVEQSVRPIEDEICEKVRNSELKQHGQYSRHLCFIKHCWVVFFRHRETKPGHEGAEQMKQRNIRNALPDESGGGFFPFLPTILLKSILPKDYSEEKVKPIEQNHRQGVGYRKANCVQNALICKQRR